MRMPQLEASLILDAENERVSENSRKGPIQAWRSEEEGCGQFVPSSLQII